jgi:DNA-binding CsgD family transcriptional regulator
MLKADDYRRVLAVLESAEQATSLKAFRSRTLDALEEEMGYRHSAFLTRNVADRRIDGMVHGQPQRRLNAYLQRWSDQEVLEAFASTRTRQPRAAERPAVYEAQLPVQARSGDRVKGAQTESMMAVWLQGGGETHGFLSLLSEPGQRFGAVDRERLLVLAPHLKHLLRHHPAEPARARSHPGLTAREAEAVDLVAAGCSNREIARRLGVTESTVKKHVSAALTKLGVNSRTQLTLAWLGKPGSRSARSTAKAAG